MSRYREASARGDMESQPASARIISRATVASTPTYPAKGSILALATVAAILLALVAAFMVEYLSPARTVAGSAAARNMAPLEDASPSPLEGASAPSRLEKVEAGPFAGDEIGSRSSAADARTLRPMAANIARIAAARKYRRLVVLDLDSPKDGTEAGVAVARHLIGADRKVVLVEAGQTRHLAAAQGHGVTTGLAELLGGDAGLGEVLSERPGSGLAMISGGRGTLPSPLPQDRMTQVIEVLEARYDVVIILGGAIAADTLALAANCNLTLLTAAPDTVKKPGFKSSIEALSGAGVTEAIVITTGRQSIGLYEAISARGQMPDVA